MAQQDISLELKIRSAHESYIRKHLKFNSSVNDSVLLRPELRKILNQLFALGFAGASIDSLKILENAATAFIESGKKYTWRYLSSGNVPEEMLRRIAFKPEYFKEADFHFKRLEKIQNDLLKYAENHGFPFAKVGLDSIEIKDEKVAGVMWMEKGTLITFDTIAQEGPSKFGDAYLEGYLGVKPGKPYSESVVKAISKRLKELAFVDEEKPFYVQFDGKKARLHLFLKNRKSSQFNFLLGFLPNNEITGRFILTGDAKLHLINPFGTGKEFLLNWKRPKLATQELQVKAAYPYLLGLPLGLDGKFELYKRDTLFLDLVEELGIQFHFIGGNYIKGFVNNTKSTLLSVDTVKVLLNRSLPEDIDISNTVYGIEYHFDRLNYKLNPTKGVSFRLNAAAGTRKIARNNTISALNDPENPGKTFSVLYDSLQLKSANLKWAAEIRKFWQLTKRSTILTGLEAGGLVTEKIFTNELYRIGGSEVLRGFDEEAILASWFNVGTLEYRFLLAENSYFYLFGDFAYVQDRSLGKFEEDWPLGFGTGLTFETKAGQFAVSYAIGRQLGNPIQFKSAKLHFGYVNYF